MPDISQPTMLKLIVVSSEEQSFTQLVASLMAWMFKPSLVGEVQEKGVAQSLETTTLEAQPRDIIQL